NQNLEPRTVEPRTQNQEPGTAILTKDTHMNRRDFINAAALTASGVLVNGGAALQAQQGVAGAQGATPPTPKPGWPSRTAKVEILFKAPGLSGNGMQCTEEGIWTIDNAGS